MKVFFRDEMVAETGSYSPSAGKPSAVADAMRFAQLPVTFVAPEAATFEQMSRAHDPKYVQDVLAGRITNGFGDKSESVRRSLPFTSGSLIAAAKQALKDGVACSLSSGFHHAGYDSGGGFCTFNGLMIAAYALQDSGLAHRIAIIDCDQHYGDGTDAIIARVGGTNLLHVSFGRNHSGPKDAPRYLAQLRSLKGQFESHRTQMVIYQAGADVHVNDPLGGVLTTEQMQERDRIMFSTCHDLGIPIAWNLAGGYQRDKNGGISAVVHLHLNTARQSIEIYGGGFPSPGLRLVTNNSQIKE